MPRSTDVPDIKVIDIIAENPNGPYGVNEVSEGSHVTTPPSVAFALHDAAGVWFEQQPITPEKIVKGLKEKGKRLTDDSCKGCKKT